MKKQKAREFCLFFSIKLQKLFLLKFFKYDSNYRLLVPIITFENTTDLRLWMSPIPFRLTKNLHHNELVSEAINFAVLFLLEKNTVKILWSYYCLSELSDHSLIMRLIRVTFPPGFGLLEKFLFSSRYHSIPTYTSTMIMIIHKACACYSHRFIRTSSSRTERIYTMLCDLCGCTLRNTKHSISLLVTHSTLSFEFIAGWF